MILGMDSSLPTVSISLWRSDAIVLFDWLSTVDLDAVPITHPAEKQALMDLFTCLEHETDVPGVTRNRSTRREKRSRRTWGGDRPLIGSRVRFEVRRQAAKRRVS